MIRLAVTSIHTGTGLPLRIGPERQNRQPLHRPSAAHTRTNFSLTPATPLTLARRLPASLLRSQHPRRTQMRGTEHPVQYRADSHGRRPGTAPYRPISRVGRDQRSSRSATSVPARERPDRRVGAAENCLDRAGVRTQITPLWTVMRSDQVDRRCAPAAPIAAARSWPSATFTLEGGRSFRLRSG